MSELAPGNRLHCGSEHHPKHANRDTMFFLEQKDGFFVFACRLCTEITRRPQIHVISQSQSAIAIYKNTRKAEHIDRDNKGAIISFR